MDIPTARKLLQVSPYATPQEIKKKYYKLALQTHPDKVSSATSTQDFQNLKDAYECLMDAPPEMNYDILMKECLGFFQHNTFLQELFNHPEKHVWTKEIGDYIALNMDDLPFPEQLRQTMIEHLNIQYLVLRPTLTELFSASFYIYKELYIPLWYHHMLYTLDNQRLVVQCIPDTDVIDDNNDIVLTITLPLEEVWRNKGLEVSIGPFKEKVPANQLLLQDYQVYRFIGHGIPKAGSTERADVVIHLYMK